MKMAEMGQPEGAIVRIDHKIKAIRDGRRLWFCPVDNELKLG